MLSYGKYVEIANDYDFEDFCNYMFDIKEIDNLTWDNIRDIINFAFGVKYTTSCYKSKFQRSHRLNNYSDIYNCDEKLLEIAKEKVKLSDQRIQINSLIRQLSREETLKEIAHDVAERMNAVKLLNTSCKISSNNDIEGLLLIGDWHYGIVIENMFNIYNTVIVKDRVAKLLKKVIDTCKKDNITKIHVANLGDMIAGDIHLPLRINSRVDVITQVLEVSEIIAEFLDELSCYAKISYCGTLDNHSRIDPNKANSIELESLARVTDWYLRSRLPYINFTSPPGVHDIAEVNICNHNIAFVHGHKDRQATMVSSINNFTQKHYDMICSAHFHHFSANEECGTFMIANGSLMGTDDHAYDLRLHSNPSQTFIEISNENVVECIKKLILIS